MSAIDNFDGGDDELRQETYHQEESFNSFTDESTKKKTNYKILLIPAAVVVIAVGFAFFKMSKPSDQPTIVSDVHVEAPAQSSAQSNPAQPTDTPFDQQASIVHEQGVLPHQIDPSQPQQQYQGAPQVPAQMPIQQGQPTYIQSPQPSVQPQTVANPVPNQQPAIVPAPMQEQQPQPQPQPILVQAPVQQGFVFDPNMTNDQLKDEINRRRSEIILLASEAKVRNLSVPAPVCSSAPAKQAVTALASASRVQKNTTPSAVTTISTKKVDASSRNDYHVYAIVDGRAWISSAAEKNNAAVAVGEHLPDGSVVQSVLVRGSRLEVKTSKGLILDNKFNAKIQ